MKATAKSDRPDKLNRRAVPKGARPLPVKAGSQELPPLSDEMIESGMDLSAYLQNPRAVPAALTAQKVNVDFPAWVVSALDREAARLGVARQALIKVWIVERLETHRPAVVGA